MGRGEDNGPREDGEAGEESECEEGEREHDRGCPSLSRRRFFFGAPGDPIRLEELSSAPGGVLGVSVPGTEEQVSEGCVESTAVSKFGASIADSGGGGAEVEPAAGRSGGVDRRARLTGTEEIGILRRSGSQKQKSKRDTARD